MVDHTTYTEETSFGVNLPSLADPMRLVDELERWLDHCESVVSMHLEQIQSRMTVLERDVRSLRSDMGGGRLEVERLLAELADRVTKLEERQS
jgi:hypothetical protein